MRGPHNIWRLIRTGAEALQATRAIRRQHAIAIAIVTLGPEGSVCSSDWGDWIIHPLHYPAVVSSIGSGDAAAAGAAAGG